MTYPTPLRPESGDRSTQHQNQYLTAASWPDLLYLASETVDPDVDLIEQVQRRVEASQ